MLYRVELPYACFGFIVENGRVVRSAPIAKWTVGKPVEKVVAYYTGKGGTVTLVASGWEQASFF